MVFVDASQITVGPITCHSFNKDRTQVALCPNNNEVHIYAQEQGQWVLQHVLSEHDKLVTSIDWAPRTNRLVTCSQDRNAYVWTRDDRSDTWRPVLVLLRINRAATFVRWSPLENKFAVASGAKTISVCYFEEENDWWVSKHIRKPLRSTVLSLDWHPNNCILACGAADNRVRVYGAAVKGLDSRPAPGPWGEKPTFNTLLAEFATGSWAHSVAFSPSGDQLAWVSHDATVGVARGGAGGPPATVATSGLPLTTVLFLNETQLVAAGHGCVPVLFQARGDAWEAGESLDPGKKKAAATGAAGSAFNKFRQMDSRAQTASTDTQLNSQHQNTVNCLREFRHSPAAVTAFTTSGVDGQLAVWNLLEAQTASLRL